LERCPRVVVRLRTLAAATATDDAVVPEPSEVPGPCETITTETAATADRVRVSPRTRARRGGPVAAAPIAPGEESVAGASTNGVSGGATSGGVGGDGGVGGVGGVGATGGVGEIGGANSGSGFTTLFVGAAHDESTFHVQIHPETVVSIGVGTAVSVVLPHVQFHTHTQVVGSPPAGAGAGAEALGSGDT
jgi:hypothetical protein